MKIELFILTYNDPETVDAHLKNLFSTDLSGHTVNITIINNHTNFSLNEEYVGRVSVIHNRLQPDWSTGFTSRNWNQALVLGFKDLNNPACDLVICAQDDTEYHHGWLPWLVEQHSKGLDFIALGVGDNLCSYTVQGVKDVGLWDERFCVLHWSEADYFLKAFLYLGTRCSINDITHGTNYTWNRIPTDVEMVRRPLGQSSLKLHLSSERHTIHAYQQTYARNLFVAKWGVAPDNLAITSVPTNTRPAIQTPFTYPYFEKDINNPRDKGYYDF